MFRSVLSCKLAKKAVLLYGQPAFKSAAVVCLSFSAFRPESSISKRGACYADTANGRKSDYARLLYADMLVEWWRYLRALHSSKYIRNLRARQRIIVICNRIKHAWTVQKELLIKEKGQAEFDKQTVALYHSCQRSVELAKVMGEKDSVKQMASMNRIMKDLALEHGLDSEH